ncbi:MAG: type II/IV secretion system ATPase subunit [Candidatus Aenigmarchaeota archaeon]|nr:type II/IV secretion system ATPase subunit [Candidatus Aenigmarchaeota archaeon]
MVFEYEYDEDAQRIRINCVGAISETSIEDYDLCMAATIEKLTEVNRAVRVVLAGSREYEYDFKEAKLLLEIGYAIERIVKEKIISIRNLATRIDDIHIQERYRFLQNLLNGIKYDPVEAYKSLLREIRHTKIKKEKETDYAAKISYQHYIDNALEPIKQMLDGCELIQIARPNMMENKNRSLYRKIFHPTIRPNFIYTRYISLPPPNAELLERYRMGDTDVEIYRIPGKLRNLYHVIPPEFRLDESEYTLLDTARRYLGRHEPVEGQLSRPETVRENLYRIGVDMLRDLSLNNNMQLSEKKLSGLAKILTRYTAGLGILDLILQDERIQDISLNSPVGTSPVYIFHGDYQECETNIVPSPEDAESWATRFRLSSGRPFDEANPVLDTELEVPGGRARVAAITRTLSPDGLGFAFRRHRDKPWTFPLFIKNRMIDSFSAGLLWFLIDGSRTMLIAGTRSSGKTSFLSACMVQIMPKIRIVSLEDTLEIPVPQLRELGYNIERLKSRSVITNVETELPAEEGLRAALRLGDSALIVGEVRSKEAIALYEAMRIGALANVVAGTIHGESAYGVFDRVVNDLGVPPTSFKATDIIAVNSMLRSPDGLRSYRRTVELTEIRKHWSSDPVKEGGFVNLLEYSAKSDALKPSKTLLTGESEILNDITSRVREWRGRWDAVIESNSMYHIASSDVKEETGSIDSKLVHERWRNWLEKKMKQ